MSFSSASTSLQPSSYSSALPVGVCVKAASLRPQYDNLGEFLSNPKNILVCRKGRVWITDKENGSKRLFTWPDSPWANPYKVGDEHTLEEALALYSAHLDALLQNEEKRSEFLQLVNAEKIGCFCDRGRDCHRDIIIAKLAKFRSDE